MCRSFPPKCRPGGTGDHGEPDHFDIRSYEYYLPENMIAQDPADPRDSSRMLVLDRSSSILKHVTFREITSFLCPGDALILNDTRVIKARLKGIKEGGTSSLEIFLLKAVPGSGGTGWEALVRPGKRIKPGQTVILDEGIRVKVLGNGKDGTRICSFPQGFNVLSFLERCGEIPLPPYIKNSTADPERYQTVYSSQNGSVAAPTAGLHFTPSLLSDISNMGVKVGKISLNVGLGTFKPVKAKDIREHVMHEEDCHIPGETSRLIREVKKSGRKVFAAGTTVVRALESRTNPDGEIEPGSFSTRAFFYPGYEFRTVDAMITNFHLPRSTLIMLVSAFAGLDLTMKAYREAVKEEYRFYSFGDAMLIL